MATSKFQMHQIMQKLKSLDHEKDKLCESIVAYVDQISDIGKTWLDSEGQNSAGFSDLNVRLSNCLTFLVKKQEEIYAGPGLDEISDRSIQEKCFALWSPSETQTSLQSAASHSECLQSSDQITSTLQERVKVLERKVETIQKDVTVSGELNEKKTVPSVPETDAREENTTEEDSDANEENIFAVGFTANVPSPVKVTADKKLFCFTNIISNIGDYFRADTGTFTAPVHGMYLTSLTHLQDGDGRLRLSLMHKLVNPSSSDHKVREVGVTDTRLNKANCSVISVVKMDEGDILYVKVCLADGGAGICRLSSFSCCFIG